MFKHFFLTTILSFSLNTSSFANTTYRHEISKDIAIEHKDLPAEIWLNSKKRLEIFRQEERIFTAPSSLAEGASVFLANAVVNLVPVVFAVGAFALTYRIHGLVAPAPAVGGAAARGGRRRAAPVAEGVAVAGMGAAFAMHFMGPVTSDLINAVKKALNYKIEYIEAIKHLKTKIFNNSEPLIPFLPASIQEKVRVMDRDIVAKLNANDAAAALKLLQAREQVLLAMPLHTHPINSKASSEIAEKFKRVIDRTLPENHATLESLIHAMEDNSKLSTEREIEGTPTAGAKTVLFLNGPRGTGKTEFVRDLAAAAGFKDVCMIKLGELENSLDLVGTGNYEGEGPSAKTQGKIVKCFLDAGVVNPIIFFEEASNSIGAEPRRSVMNQSMGELNGAYKKLQFLEIFKTLFEKDPTSATFKLQGLMEGSFDMSRATFILAGNFPLHKDLASGGRVTNVYFGPLSSEQKMNAINDALNVRLQRLESSDREKIKGAFTEELKKFILSKDQNRFIPGARIIKEVVQKTITYILHTYTLEEHILKQYIGRTIATEDKRDLLEKKNDALAIAISKQTRRLRDEKIEFTHIQEPSTSTYYWQKITGSQSEELKRTLSKTELSYVIEILREVQETILITSSDHLPEPQAISGKIEVLCNFIIQKVGARDLVQYPDDEIETFAITERELQAQLMALFPHG